MIETSRVSVTTTATPLATLHKGSVAIKATGDMYIGGDGVTTANGWLVPSGDVITVDTAKDDMVYGIVASVTVTASVLKSRGRN